jgi:hypothetical protein
MPLLPTSRENKQDDVKLLSQQLFKLMRKQLDIFADHDNFPHEDTTFVRIQRSHQTISAIQAQHIVAIDKTKP